MPSLCFLAKCYSRPRKMPVMAEGPEQNLSAQMLGWNALSPDSSPFNLVPSCLAMRSILVLNEIQPQAIKTLCHHEQSFIIFPFI